MNLYEKLLASSKEIIADLERPFKVREEKSKLNLRIVQLESEIATNQRNLQELKGKHPLDFDKVLAATDTLELSERKMVKLKALEEELFIKEVK
jgi:hypothetical protein